MSPPTADRSLLARLSTSLLCAEDNGELADAAIALHALYCSLSGFDPDLQDSRDLTPILLPCGMAISPADAGRCVLDHARTSRYLRAACAAIRALLARGSARPIEILYAGCGSFAALALPLMTQFGADAIRVTLIDVNAHALESAARMVRALGFCDHVGAYVQADASVYVPDAAFDILILEMMQRALEKEPQVAVTLNLAPRLASGGILIPQEIVVDACLFDPATEFRCPARGDSSPAVSRMRVELGMLIRLNAKSAQQIAASLARNSVVLPAVSVALPSRVDSGLQLMLRTSIQLFGSIRLDEYESGLTHPVIVPGPVEACVAFEYTMRPEPSFRRIQIQPR